MIYSELINKWDSYNFPFIIFLVQKVEDITDLQKEFIQYENIDKRNISFFISPLKFNANKEKNIKLIKQKIYKIIFLLLSIRRCFYI